MFYSILIIAEYSGESDAIDKLRQRLNLPILQNEAFAKEFDRIATEDGDDLILALENNEGQKADIFTKRTINPLKQAKH
jgi:ribosomal protein L16 Arg81 hydroxylase